MSIITLGLFSLFLEAWQAPVDGIDRTMAAAWLANGVRPERCDDLTYLRRVTLDLAGRIPTLDEARAFEKDARPDKRALLVDRLLVSAECADHWSRFWTPLYLGREVDDRGREQFRLWLRDQLAANVSHRALAEKLLAAAGKSDVNPAVHFVAAHLGTPTQAGKEARDGQFDMLPITSRSIWLFLGTQIQCAQCHCHPFNVDWNQKHFWGINAFFRQVGRNERGGAIELRDNPELNAKGIVFFGQRNGVFLPAQPSFFDGRRIPAGAAGTRREHLARFITGHERFSQALVNRLWRQFLGRDLTARNEDDFGSHNEVVHPQLLEQLARDFSAAGHDVRQLVRWICASEVYQLKSSSPRADEDAALLYLRRQVRPMSFDQLVGSILTASGAGKSLKPDEQQQLRAEWRDHLIIRQADTKADDDAFRQPAVDPLMMIFWRMNNGSINAAIERLELPADDRPESIIDTLYLTTLTRHPSDQESAALIKKLAKELDQRQPEQRNLVWRDLFWALLNCKEFTDHR